MNDNTAPKTDSAGLSRYRGLIISIGIFVVLLTGLLAYANHISNEIEEDSVQSYVTAEMANAYGELLENVQMLKLNTHQDPKNPLVQGALKRTKEAQDAFSRSLQATAKGGDYLSIDGRQYLVDAADKGVKKALMEEMVRKWKESKIIVDAYLKKAEDPTADASLVDAALLSLQNNNARFTEITNFLLANKRAKLEERGIQLRNVEIFGIGGAVLYLALFLAYFIRKLLAADKSADAAKKETTEIMDTVTTGLFLLDKDLTIGSQYSKQLESLIGQKNVGGKNLLDVLSSFIDTKDLNTTNDFVGQLYNARTKERLIASLNPLIRQKVKVDGNERFLDFNFRRVYHGKAITRVLVNVEDVTDAVLLEQKMEQEREQNDVQLEMLSTILQADRDSLNDFINNTKQRIQSINSVLKVQDESGMSLYEKVNAIYREVHSMKGEASALKLSGFTNMAENFETNLNRLKQTPKLSGENFLGLTVQLEELIRLTHTIEDLLAKIGGTAPVTLDGKQAATPQTTRSRYADFVADIAKRNKKEAAFTYSGLESTGNKKMDRVITEIAIQLLRNAVVHGIEKPEIRNQRGKLTIGHVHMGLKYHGDRFVLTFEDDGNGIDYRAIAQKAVSLGRYTEEEAANLDRKTLVSLLFSPGFSTANDSTEDAGRGIGLDIIKDRIISLNGTVNVTTRPQGYTRFTFTLPKLG
ncbi:ATPase/histidine kinase/DNA gyrase B/HSP90 domain protein [Neisseria sp. oral taxon 020 str. F0370]|uniref:ATP-binding protein n=1 Tax=Neisseria sp. oral taxon 020 TaxID=712401 RepID=UPI0002A25413|nr:ATP-binding protein [Neisseria sp. oral taxon 020]EKY07211.1 ATPase/histidine kinase/DNA gyrase B/HSP90 domain protein [Neisseria sp. oral taxon 020 str. F0370]